jgi:hypothetical protein
MNLKCYKSVILDGAGENGIRKFDIWVNKSCSKRQLALAATSMSSDR